MKWLEKNGKGLITLQKDSALLKAVGILERHLDADDSDNDLIDVIQALNQMAFHGQDAETYKKILTEKGVDTEKTVEQWRRLRKRLDEVVPDNYAALGYPLYALTSPPEGITPTITWPLLEEGETATPSTDIDSLALTLSGNVGLKMEFEAAPKTLPSGLNIEMTPPPEKQRVRINLQGTLKGTADADLPLELLTASAGMESTLNADISWYFNNAQKSLFATALGKNLATFTTSPFDLEGMEALMAPSERNAPSLACLSATLDGNLGFSGNMKVSKPLLAGAAGNVAVSAEFGFRVKKGGGYRYQLYSDGKPGLVLNIGRSCSHTRERSLNLAIDFDFTPMYSKFQSLVLSEHEEFDRLMSEFAAILPRDSQLQTDIGQQLDNRIEDADTRALIKAAIGFDAEKSAGDLLAEYIMSEVETTTARWSSDAKEAATDVADSVLGGLSIMGDAAKSLRDMALDEAERIIDRENKRLNERLEELLQGDGAEKLKNKLAAISEEISDSIAYADDKLALFVREALTHYQREVKKICDALKKAAEAKLCTQWSYEQSRSKGTTVDLQIRFLEINEESKAIYRQMVCGSIDTVTRQLFSDSSATPSIEIIGGELQHIVNLDRKSAFEISLFGTTLSSTRELDVDVSYIVNREGNIRVFSQGEITANRKAWKEGRCLRFIDVFELAVAEKTRSLDLNLTLSQDDEDVDEEDIRGFFSSLEEEKLVTAGTTDRAMARLDDIRTKTPGADIKGRLEAGFSIESDAIENLLGLETAPGGGRSKKEIMTIAIDELLKVARRTSAWNYKITKNTEKCIREDFPRFDPPLPGTLSAAIHALDNDRYERAYGQTQIVCPREGYEKHQLDETLRAINQYHNHAANICHMISTLNRVYRSSHNTQNWSAENYRDAQKEIDRYLRQWLRVGSKFIFFLPEKIRPFTIGFIQIMRRLANMPLSKESSTVSARLALGERSYDLTE